jgi:hypothetical protein
MIRPRCLISLASEGNARGYSEAALSDGPYRLVLVCVPLLSPYVWPLPWLAAPGAWHLPRCKVVCGGVFEGRRSAGIPCTGPPSPRVSGLCENPEATEDDRPRAQTAHLHVSKLLTRGAWRAASCNSHRTRVTCSGQGVPLRRRARAPMSHDKPHERRTCNDHAGDHACDHAWGNHGNDPPSAKEGC